MRCNFKGTFRNRHNLWYNLWEIWLFLICFVWVTLPTVIQGTRVPRVVTHHGTKICTLTGTSITGTSRYQDFFTQFGKAEGKLFFKTLHYFTTCLNDASAAFVFLFSSGKIGQTRSALRKGLLQTVAFLQVSRPGFLLLGSFNADCRGLLHLVLVVCIWERK